MHAKGTSKLNVDESGVRSYPAALARSPLKFHFAQVTTAADTELRVHVAQVVLHRFPADVELTGHLGIGQPAGHEKGNIALAVGEVESGTA